MSFRFSGTHIEEFRNKGFTVFRAILPPSLIADLRRASDGAREVARRARGSQAQRLQPIVAYDLELRPFLDYQELPQLKDALARVLSPRHRLGGNPSAPLGTLGLLLEPAELPWCTPWHRDWRDHQDPELASHWEKSYLDLNLFNQTNCALYADNATWIVPGSHLRPDLPQERSAFPEQPPRPPMLEGLSVEEREQACLDYCRRMPGAHCLHLNAGDFALYRNTLWHLGNYLPYQRRTTLHDSLFTPEYEAWQERMIAMRRQQAGRAHSSALSGGSP